MVLPVEYGWLQFPYETRGVLPYLVRCRRWHVWKPLSSLLASPIAITGLPLEGLLTPFDLGLSSQLTVKRMTITSMKAPDELD